MEELGPSAQRIYDPFAYRPVLRERFVPVSMAEAFGLAPRHPIAWRRDAQGDLQLVAIRSLNPEAEVPGIHTLPRDGLPLLLQAFPFRFRDAANGDFEVGLDRSAPARERDSGSYVFDERGTMLPGAELKLRALEEFRREVAMEAVLLQAASRHGLLEPVVLPEPIRSRYVLPDFVVVVSDPDDRLLLQDLPKDKWMTAMRFLTAQRLSLYQMARLIAWAEAA
jgi:hypothetical protein